MVTASSELIIPRVRWTWLSNPRADIIWNLAPFWFGYALVSLLWLGRGYGDGVEDSTALNFTLGSVHFHLGMWAFMLYGPLVDAPHLGATIARTYIDREEWAARRRLFLASLVWFLVGPVVILLPYALAAIVPSAAGSETLGWIMWGHFFTFYALFHVNKQHWGFVALYKRKNADHDPLENRADQWFFYTSIWLPFACMMTAPWFRGPDGQPVSSLQAQIAGTSIAELLHPVLRAAFFLVCAAYIAFQLSQWRRGIPRNGPKLVYLATVIPLQFVAFTLHPFVAAFWVITTGIGHCAQYHRVVWTYGEKKYVEGAPAQSTEPTLTARIFSNVWLYVAFAIGFGVLTLQGPGAHTMVAMVASFLNEHLFRNVFTTVGRDDGIALGAKVAAAFIGGVRLHHFYVDSKIWRVSKSQALAKNLNV